MIREFLASHPANVTSNEDLQHVIKHFIEYMRPKSTLTDNDRIRATFLAFDLRGLFSQIFFVVSLASLLPVPTLRVLTVFSNFKWTTLHSFGPMSLLDGNFCYFCVVDH